MAFKNNMTSTPCAIWSATKRKQWGTGLKKTSSRQISKRCTILGLTSCVYLSGTGTCSICKETQMRHHGMQTEWEICQLSCLRVQATGLTSIEFLSGLQNTISTSCWISTAPPETRMVIPMPVVTSQIVVIGTPTGTNYGLPRLSSLLRIFARKKVTAMVLRLWTNQVAISTVTIWSASFRTQFNSQDRQAYRWQCQW